MITSSIIFLACRACRKDQMAHGGQRLGCCRRSQIRLAAHMQQTALTWQHATRQQRAKYVILLLFAIWAGTAACLNAVSALYYVAEDGANFIGGMVSSYIEETQGMSWLDQAAKRDTPVIRASVGLEHGWPPRFPDRSSLTSTGPRVAADDSTGSEARPGARYPAWPPLNLDQRIDMALLVSRALLSKDPAEREGARVNRWGGPTYSVAWSGVWFGDPHKWVNDGYFECPPREAIVDNSGETDDATAGYVDAEEDEGGCAIAFFPMRARALRAVSDVILYHRAPGRYEEGQLPAGYEGLFDAATDNAWRDYWANKQAAQRLDSPYTSGAGGSSSAESAKQAVDGAIAAAAAGGPESKQQAKLREMMKPATVDTVAFWERRRGVDLSSKFGQLEGHAQAVVAGTATDLEDASWASSAKAWLRGTVMGSTGSSDSSGGDNGAADSSPDTPQPTQPLQPVVPGTFDKRWSLGSQRHAMMAAENFPVTFLPSITLPFNSEVSYRHPNRYNSEGDGGGTNGGRVDGELDQGTRTGTGSSSADVAPVRQRPMTLPAGTGALWRDGGYEHLALAMAQAWPLHARTWSDLFTRPIVPIDQRRTQWGNNGASHGAYVYGKCGTCGAGTPVGGPGGTADGLLDLGPGPTVHATVSWASSHCYSRSGRERLVYELMQAGLHIDISGQTCLGNVLQGKPPVLPPQGAWRRPGGPRPRYPPRVPRRPTGGGSPDAWTIGDRDAEAEAWRHYKFHLVLENSVCDDYVTEKAFLAFARGQVPIVMSAPNFGDYAPSKDSYIDVRDFRSVQDLVKHIQAVDKDEALYAQYHAWRTRPFRTYGRHLRDVVQGLVHLGNWTGPGEPAAATWYACDACRALKAEARRMRAGAPRHPATSTQPFSCWSPLRFTAGEILEARDTINGVRQVEVLLSHPVAPQLLSSADVLVRGGTGEDGVAGASAAQDGKGGGQQPSPERLQRHYRAVLRSPYAALLAGPAGSPTTSVPAADGRPVGDRSGVERKSGQAGQTEDDGLWTVGDTVTPERPYGDVVPQPLDDYRDRFGSAPLPVTGPARDDDGGGGEGSLPSPGDADPDRLTLPLQLPVPRTLQPPSSLSAIHLLGEQRLKELHADMQARAMKQRYALQRQGLALQGQPAGADAGTGADGQGVPMDQRLPFGTTRGRGDPGPGGPAWPITAPGLA